MPISMPIDTMQPPIWHFDNLGQSQDVPAKGDFLSHMSAPVLSKVDGVTDAKPEEAETPPAESCAGQDIGALISHDLPAVPPPVAKDAKLEGVESAPSAPLQRPAPLPPPHLGCGVANACGRTGHRGGGDARPTSGSSARPYGFGCCGTRPKIRV